MDHSGVCGLCHQAGGLRDSHLLPAAVYKLAREADRRDPNPIIVTPSRAGSTSKQVSAYFLCARCEDRFSAGGERYVLSQCARPGGAFALRDLVNAAPLLCRDDRFEVHDVTAVPGLDSDKYLYFAASVFWRAAARKWVLEGQALEQLSLGKTYQEQLRLFLLGSAQFPDKGRLFVHVWSDDRVDFTTVFPCSARVDQAWRHKFCIPGVLFILFFGGDVPQRQDGGALNSRAGWYMWLCRWADDSLFSGFAGLVQTARRSRRVHAGDRTA